MMEKICLAAFGVLYPLLMIGFVFVLAAVVVVLIALAARVGEDMLRMAGVW